VGLEAHVPELHVGYPGAQSTAHEFVGGQLADRVAAAVRYLSRSFFAITAPEHLQGLQRLPS
jgi:hypothetical protein